MGGGRGEPEVAGGTGRLGEEGNGRGLEFSRCGLRGDGDVGKMGGGSAFRGATAGVVSAGAVSFWASEADGAASSLFSSLCSSFAFFFFFSGPFSNSFLRRSFSSAVAGAVITLCFLEPNAFDDSARPFPNAALLSSVDPFVLTASSSVLLDRRLEIFSSLMVA